MLDQLARELLDKKTQINDLKSQIIQLETKLASQVGVKEEGSTSAKTDTFKITTTGKFTRNIDHATYLTVKDNIPDGLDPIVLKPAIDLKKLRSIESANPALAELCHQFITVKPAKTAVKVEVL